MLVIGCGNSNLSAGLYEDGFQVTSIDFSEVVIQEMRTRHPNMTWDLMDMTAMTYPAASFHAVVDKGSLDALMSEDNDLAASQARTMFDEITRVLVESGIYIVISLGQDHILRALLNYFGHDYSIEVSIVVELRSNPLVPYIFIISKTTTKTSRLRLKFDSMGCTLAEGRTVTSSDAILQVA